MHLLIAADRFCLIKSAVRLPRTSLNCLAWIFGAGVTTPYLFTVDLGVSSSFFLLELIGKIFKFHVYDTCFKHVLFQLENIINQGDNVYIQSIFFIM